MSKLEQILNALPQTQCGLCQHSGCTPYAKALIEGTDTIDKCHPGGEKTLSELAAILEISAKPYIKTVKERTVKTSTVIIDSKTCIGCTKCIQVCPVDAIIGTSKANHIVIESECTGCNLCLPACPVDCMHEQASSSISAKKLVANYRRQRFEARNNRIEQTKSASKILHKNNKTLVKQRLHNLVKKHDV